MKCSIYSIALPLLVAVGWAQNAPPAAPPKQPASALQEMKTQVYSGTLVDASCAAGSKTCSLSANATQFAIQTKDGQTMRFDDIGNVRAQEALKAHKKWTESITANKPLRVKVGGVLNGDKLTVVSVD
jgi:hypothetical protein